jgi:uncharacterized membrane protein YbhN (UPF0104 family)
MLQRRALTLIQILVSLACLGWLWSKPEIHQQLVGALIEADPLWLVWGLLMAGLVIGLGIVRWQWFLRLQGLPISWRENARLSLIGAFFNLILLGTVGGDAVKILYLARRYPDKRSEAVVSILMDHLCGLPAVIVLYACFSLARWDWLAASGLSSQMALFAGIYLGGSLLGIGLLFLAAARGMTHWTPRRLPFREHAIRFSQALLLFGRHWRLTTAGILLSFAIHALYFGTFQAAAMAMHAGVHWIDLFTIMPVVDVIATLPISISGVGIRETLFESFLQRLCEVPSDIGVAISLLGFGFSVFWSLLGGALFPFDRPLRPGGGRETLREVIHEARQSDTEASEPSTPMEEVATPLNRSDAAP